MDGPDSFSCCVLPGHTLVRKRMKAALKARVFVLSVTVIPSLSLHFTLCAEPHTLHLTVMDL
jgi:hypothetical protein